VAAADDDVMVTQGAQPGSGRTDEQAVRRPRYGLLLVLLTCSYLVSAFTTGRMIGALQLLLFSAAALLALRNSSIPRRTRRLILAAAIAGTAFMLALVLTAEVGLGIANLWTGLILLSAVVMIMYRVLSFETVSLQSIYGALSAYLVIGLMFAAFFGAMDRLGGGHFFAHGQPTTTQTLQYFSFTTLTTLGYGDFTALGNAGRAVAVLEALTGQVFLATLVARLMAAFRAPTSRDR
jgi:hypothetical protein